MTNVLITVAIYICRNAHRQSNVVLFCFVLQWYLKPTVCLRLNWEDSCLLFMEIIFGTVQVNGLPENSSGSQQQTCEELRHRCQCAQRCGMVDSTINHELSCVLELCKWGYNTEVFKRVLSNHKHQSGEEPIAFRLTLQLFLRLAPVVNCCEGLSTAAEFWLVECATLVINFTKVIWKTAFCHDGEIWMYNLPLAINLGWKWQTTNDFWNRKALRSWGRMGRLMCEGNQ